MKMLFINGWGAFLQGLDPLKMALEQEGYDVDMIDYVNVLEPSILEKNIELLHDYDVVAGWSLGGQVATVLLYEYYQKYGQKYNQTDSHINNHIDNPLPRKILWTLFSNPSFIIHQNWKNGITEYEFKRFKRSFIDQPERTLLHFALKNTDDIWHQSSEKYREIQTVYLNQDGAYQHLLMGLDLLQQLNTVPYLKYLSSIGCPIFYFLADGDSLAPKNLYEELSEVNVFDISYETLSYMEWIKFKSHFSVYTQAELVAKYFTILYEDIELLEDGSWLSLGEW